MARSPRRQAHHRRAMGIVVVRPGFAIRTRITTAQICWEGDGRIVVAWRLTSVRAGNCSVFAASRGVQTPRRADLCAMKDLANVEVYPFLRRVEHAGAYWDWEKPPQSGRRTSASLCLQPLLHQLPLPCVAAHTLSGSYVMVAEACLYFVMFFFSLCPTLIHAPELNAELSFIFQVIARLAAVDRLAVFALGSLLCPRTLQPAYVPRGKTVGLPYNTSMYLSRRFEGPYA